MKIRHNLYYFIKRLGSIAGFTGVCYGALVEEFMADNVGSKVSYFLVGLGVGALMGVLFAPKSGEDTRDYLAKRADDGREFAQKKAKELRERADELIERGKDVASKKRESLSAAVDAGREAFLRESKS
jgi:gas vesicle protein